MTPFGYPNLNTLFEALGRSSFRSRFRLRAQEQAYFHAKGMATVAEHARRFIAERLAPAVIGNDGQQTPMRGHPVFVAQHATATCCRQCLQQWHKIATGRALTLQEQAYVLEVLLYWISQQTASTKEIFDTQCARSVTSSSKNQEKNPCVANPQQFSLW